MKEQGYYEIIDYDVYQTGLKASAISGNVRFNRMHWHDSLEIICCVYGTLDVNVQGHLYRLEPGDLTTIERGQRHEVSSSPNGMQLIFSVDPSVLYEMEPKGRYALTTVGEDALPKHHEDIRKARISIAKMMFLLLPDAELLDELEETLKHSASKLQLGCLKTEEQWYQFHGELYQILACLARHKQPLNPLCLEKDTFGHFTKCVEIVHKDYGKPLSARTVALNLGFSEPTVYRLFQKHLGMSFINYLNSVRISAACGLIDKSNYSMTEISDRCGFASLSNFYRAFHQFTGMSPREYRQRLGISPEKSKNAPKDLMLLNRFEAFWELPYTKEEIWDTINAL